MRKMRKFCNSKVTSLQALLRTAWGTPTGEQAKRARKLYHTVGAPTVETFKYMLRSNIIKDCPVTEKDAKIVEKIFGPDVITLKGKTTRRKPNVVKEDEIEVPPELVAESDDLVYCMDIFLCQWHTNLE